MTLAEFAEAARVALKPLEQNASMLWWTLDQPGLVSRSGTWCEFGVHGGSTLRGIAQRNTGATLWGFDSFRGLPEDWNRKHPKGMFKLERPIMPPEGVNLMVGWFADVLPAFHPPPVTFIYVDCDLYSAARTVMKWSLGKTAPGCVIVFDDFFSPPLENSVARALYDVCIEDGFRFDWVGKNQGGDMAAIRVAG